LKEAHPKDALAAVRRIALFPMHPKGLSPNFSDAQPRSNPTLPSVSARNYELLKSTGSGFQPISGS
jgi:hypothetical protein